jgi:predicted metal-binding membrane protein
VSVHAPAASPRGLAAARAGGVPLPVLGAIGVAWAASILAEATGVGAQLHHDALLGHGAPPLLGVLGFLAGWQLMIAAMMLPSSLPLVRMLAAASVRVPDRGRVLAAFLAAYALVWSAFGLLAFAGDLGLHALVNASGWMHEHEWAIGPSALLAAGAFQFSSLKDACLRACRHPASFMQRHYRRGAGGAFRLGLRHAAFCVGCCWALMLVMFAAGVASLVWMALLTTLMVHEKTRPSGQRTVPITGAVLLALGSTLLLWGAYAAGAG